VAGVRRQIDRAEVEHEVAAVDVNAQRRVLIGRRASPQKERRRNDDASEHDLH
jgi:hypothetical protein